MIIMVDEMWNSVVIYGPQSEIDRVKRQGIRSLAKGDVDELNTAFDPEHIVRIGTDVENEDAWNFRELRGSGIGSYGFAFDTVARFPKPVFECLAKLFPTLAFDCECTADNDSSMGYGWFNPPPGGEAFRDDYAVPEGYWSTGIGKRTAEARLLHSEMVNKLRRSYSLY